jgi:hypothetical protein
MLTVICAHARKSPTQRKAMHCTDWKAAHLGGIAEATCRCGRRGLSRSLGRPQARRSERRGCVSRGRGGARIPELNPAPACTPQISVLGPRRSRVTAKHKVRLESRVTGKQKVGLESLIRDYQRTRNPTAVEMISRVCDHINQFASLGCRVAVAMATQCNKANHNKLVHTLDAASWTML